MILRYGLLLLLMDCAGVGAATIYVDTAADSTNDVDGLTSLREAVIWANTNAGSDTIEIPAGFYVRTIAGSGEDDARTGDLDVMDDTVIAGEGADNTIIDAAGMDRVIFFRQDRQITLMDLTLRGGSSSIGGGIYNESTARVVRCSIESNVASFYGGGVHNFTGNMFIEHSTVMYNYAGSDGGGGVDVNGGSVVVSNSTVSWNLSYQGGGLNRDGGTLSLYNSTVAFNEAAHDSGGIYGKPNAMMGAVAHTIIAHNIAPDAPDITAPVNSLGYNLIGITTNPAGFGALDLLGTNALLGPLQDNGGPTPTHALLAGSPAINRADPGQPPGADQRGMPRPRGRGPDIGAVEEQAPDEDLDRIPDEWEMQYGLNPTNAEDASSQSDADDFSNLDEYFADTNPTSALSFHRLLSISSASSECVITFQSSTARVYSLEYVPDSTNLWVEIVNGLAGQPGFTYITNNATDPARFYRTRVRPPTP